MPLFNLLEKFNGEKPFEKIAKGGESREIRRSLDGGVERVCITCSIIQQVLITCMRLMRTSPVSHHRLSQTTSADLL